MMNGFASLRFYLTALALLIMLCMPCRSSAQFYFGEACMATNFKLKDLSGRELALKDFRGKIVIMVIGELYQQNTIKALQDIKKLLQKKSSYREASEVLVVVSEHSTSPDYLKQAAGSPFSYPVLTDHDRNVYAQYEVKAMPTTILISSIGTIAARLSSYTIAYYDQLDAGLGYMLGEIDQEALRRITSPEPALARTDSRTERLISLADHLLRRGFYDSAGDAYRNLLEIRPDLKQARIGMGSIYLMQGRSGPAEKEFRAVLKNDPQDPAAMQGLAQVYLKNGNPAEAESLLKKVILSGFVDESTYYILGEIYEQQGRFEEAVKYFKQNCRRQMQKIQ